jgi:type IV pilus assembly protein PilV
MRIPTNNQNGFTLVELLIALVIFAVGILGVATMQISSIKGNSKGRQISEAVTVGADRIERFISMSYDDSALDDDDGDGTAQDVDADGADDNGGNFGLDDLTNPDGIADTDGDGTNDLFWNVAVDHPLPNTKTIKLFIEPLGAGKTVEMIYIMADII